MEKLDKLIDNESFNWYEKNYKPCIVLFQDEKDGIFEVTDLLKNIKQKNKTYYFIDNKQKCRFCGQSAPSVTFKDKAHTFPEFLGNKLFVNKNSECDNCNHKFGENYEPDLSKFLLPFLTLDQIKGKKGTRKYKSNDHNSIVSSENDKLKIEETVGYSKLIRDDDNKQISYSFDVPQYSMLNVYKSILKMALSIIPENKIDLLKYKFYSLNEDNPHGDEVVQFCFYPGFKRFGLNVFLYERIDINNHKIPLYQFAVMCNNFMLQIPIYGDCDINNLNGERFDMQLYQIPSPFDKNEIYGDVKIKNIINMGIVEKHTETIILKYDSMKESN